MRFILGLIAVLVFTPFTVNAAWAVSWETSCRVDKGSIKRQSGAYIFKTSKNHCSGGIFNQRAELSSSSISISRKASYVFQSQVSMQSNSSEPFIIFQIHDGRIGCSPPLSLRWNSGDRLQFDSDYTQGKGMAGCVSNSKLRQAAYRGQRLKRDGTLYDLQVRLDFDGDGGFDVEVSIDEKKSIAGAYRPSSNPGFVKSKRFYMKHGVYSQNMFTYEMRSSGMKVSKR